MPLASLKGFLADHFALCGFYDLVQRHNEAVNAANWREPFPIDAARNFFGVVDENTPRFFEAEVGEGLRQVEESAPQAAPSAAIEPPPLPFGTPDAERSHERQMATAANALWEAFLKGENLPLDQQAWREAAEKLGTKVRPILDFLRALDETKA
jgi:predicted component of type VI protein secretion system